MNANTNKIGKNSTMNTGRIDNDSTAAANPSALSFAELEPVIAPAIDVFLKVD